jgi:hypothetical protein
VTGAPDRQDERVTPLAVAQLRLSAVYYGCCIAAVAVSHPWERTFTVLVIIAGSAAILVFIITGIAGMRAGAERRRQEQGNV